MTESLVSVIIPNWNGYEHLPDCLDSLQNQTYSNTEVVVVDNASTDGSIQLIADQFPWVHVIRLDSNLGFTGACNIGLRESDGDILILLNNDTQVEQDWVEMIVDAFDRHPHAGSVASKMLLFDQRDCFHTAGDYYRLNGIPGNRGVWQQDLGQYDREEMVFSACGGSSAYRREMLDQVGLLDERFFFSAEDVDIGWRAQLMGWKCVYSPQAVVYHKLQATGGGSIASYHNGRNFIFLIVKNYPWSLLRKNLGAVIGAQWNISVEAVRAFRGKAARARLKGQLVGLLYIPLMLKSRWQIMSQRTVSDKELLLVLTPVDEVL